MTPQMRLVAAGVGWALAVAIPADLLAQIADAAKSGDGRSPLVWPCVAVILIGMAVGGAVVGSRAHRDRELAAATNRLGAGAGVAAIAVVLALGIGRSLVAGHSVSWAAVPFLLALGGFLGSIGAVVGRARASTSRP